MAITDPNLSNLNFGYLFGMLTVNGPMFSGSHAERKQTKTRDIFQNLPGFIDLIKHFRHQL